MENISQESGEVSLEQLVISHSYEMLALVTVLERKGILTRQEIIAVIREMQGGGGDLPQEKRQG